MENEILPVGSIVKLNEKDNYCMIVGYFPYSDNDDNVHTYSGVMYPVGLVEDGPLFMFNHDQIYEVVWKGYINNKHDDFLTFVQNMEDIFHVF